MSICVFLFVQNDFSLLISHFKLMTLWYNIKVKWSIYHGLISGIITIRANFQIHKERDRQLHLLFQTFLIKCIKSPVSNCLHAVFITPTNIFHMHLLSHRWWRVKDVSATWAQRWNTNLRGVSLCGITWHDH